LPKPKRFVTNPTSVGPIVLIDFNSAATNNTTMATTTMNSTTPIAEPPLGRCARTG